MKKIYPLLALVICLALAFSGCGKGGSSNKTADVSDIADTWRAAAMYYEDKLIDLNDSDSLKDLYDTDFVVINDDASFVYTKFVNYVGVCEATDEENVIVLRTNSVTRYNIDNGKLAEDDQTDVDKTSYVICFLDDSRDTFRIDELVGENIHPEIGDSTMIYTRDGKASSYILENKTPLNGGSSSSSSSSNSSYGSSSYGGSYTTKKYTYTTTTTRSYYASSGERNALEKAHDYLDYSAFSYKGLIEQLEFEGFTKSEATYAVDNCGADWNEQAVKKARQYLDYSSFSRSGLVDQLEFEGFTHSQAEYGVSVAY